MSSPALVRRTKLYEQVVSRVVDDVLSGNFPPGSLLPGEDALRERYGVGRLAIREALLTLERLGVTCHNPGIGIQVIVPSPSQIVDTLDLGVLHYLSHTKGSHTQLREVRRAVEVDIARLAATRATDFAIASMRSALDLGARTIDDRENYLKADRAFHAAVGVAAANPIFAAFQSAVRRWIESYPSIRVHVPGSDQRSHEDHQRIFDAIVARDAEQAALAMGEHLAVDYSLEGKLRRIKDLPDA